MRYIIKYRWFILLLWIAFALGLFLFGPDLSQLVREKGDIDIPDGTSAKLAEEWLNEFESSETDDTVSGALVFHNPDGLSNPEKDEVRQAIETLKTEQKNLGLTNIMAFYEYPELEDQLVSKNETTIIVPFSADISNRTIIESRDDIYQTINVNVAHNITGDSYISQDVITNSERGLKRTEYITIGFILIILFIVFKSLVAPFIPLITIGISYLAAQGIVAILANTVNFPLSTFTQIFMVAVMFGIGTDYCILLISRFKEELTKQPSVPDAIIATYRSGGKTVLFAGIAVLIGFSTIGLSTFNLYQSAVAVAVGVAVILVALPTLVPFFMMLLGEKLFWPFSGNIQHKQSRLWQLAGNLSWKRPLISVLIVAVITIPSILLYDGDRSYNSLEEIGSEYDSVQGFNWIAEHFGPGEAMPVSIVLKTDNPVDSSEEFQDLEKLAYEIHQLDGVSKVRTVTRPTGTLIEEFKISNQSSQIENGLAEGMEGLSMIKEGLTKASDQLKESEPQLLEAENGAQSLMNGTLELQTGIAALQSALQDIQTGMEQGTAGLGEVKLQLISIQEGLNQLSAGSEELINSYHQIESGLGQIQTNYAGVLESLKQTRTVLEQVLTQLNQTEEEHESLAADQHYQTAKQQIQGVLEGMSGTIEDLAALNEQLLNIQKGLQQANTGYKQAVQSQQELSNGLGQLIDGVAQLEQGFSQASSGQSQVIQTIPSIEQGLEEIYGGQSQLKQAFTSLNDELIEFSDGLNQGAGGIGDVIEGLDSIQSYMKDLSSQENSQTIYIPEEALEDKDFQKAMDTYLSEDRQLIKLEAILEVNPYSNEALNQVEIIRDTIQQSINGTAFENAEFATGGVSSMYDDLQRVSDKDYSRTVTLMLAGIFIMLLILLRSVVMPIYLIGSLILTYYTSMGIAELIFVNRLGYGGLSWAVPFFAFVMLVALGIDYSIFLMDRFNEHKDMSMADGLLEAMKNMGTVILSAAIILGGTFAAMYPSGVLSLTQIATIVLSGLLLYAVIVIPLFVPVMVKLFGPMNWWPFRRHQEPSKTSSSNTIDA
ncbi:MAG: MMPL family transporter [Bacillaceae bacterium]|nr:MMPL family transporter [Bacillaceae bacterium]